MDKVVQVMDDVDERENVHVKDAVQVLKKLDLVQLVLVDLEVLVLEDDDHEVIVLQQLHFSTDELVIVEDVAPFLDAYQELDSLLKKKKMMMKYILMKHYNNDN